MAESDRSRFPGPAARERFARTLHLWRVRAGWAHDTLDRWGEAAGFTRVQNSVFSKLERGLTQQPLPLTFIQLGIANDRLARKDYGLLTDRKLRDLVQAQQAITDDQGNPWNECHFFGHFCGTIPAPAWADLPELMSPAEAERISLQQREIFDEYAQGLMLPPPVAFGQLESHCKGMSPEQVKTFRRVLGGWHIWTPEEMGELTDGAGKNAAVQAMLAWCDQDDLCRKFRNMCPD
jgi:hypothetical protein